MGHRAQNIEDSDVAAAWLIVTEQGRDPSERVSVQGMKRVSGVEGAWERCVLKGPRWAIAMLKETPK